MPSLESGDDLFSPRYLSPNPSGSSSLLKSPSRQSLSLNGRKSSASLRSSPLSSSLADDEVNGRHSLAHELAAALLPEPSTGSKLLAEEFGIEYDEGAEGIDGVPAGSYDESSPHSHTPYEDDIDIGGGPAANSLAAQLNGASPHSPIHELDFGQPLHTPTKAGDVAPTLDPGFRSPVGSPTRPRRQPEQDPMAILAADLEYTEKFLAQLRRLDAGDQPTSLSSSTASLSGSGAGTTGTGTLERLASDMIRRINDATRDREGQVRELLEYEREFRKISADPGGTDALAHLPELEDLVTDADSVQTPGPSSSSARAAAAVGKAEAVELDAIGEDANDWEVDPDQRARLGDDDDDGEDDYDARYSPQATPVKTEFPPPPPLSGPATPAAAIPLLTHLRTFTTSTATSLATISEHTQVNAAATTEAGRKIRALKNKLGGWRTEWDSAERSRVRIEKWEAGIVDGDTPPAAAGAMSPPRVQRRIDGRKIVQEHLKAFEQALLEANEKTQAIIAAVS